MSPDRRYCKLQPDWCTEAYNHKVVILVYYGSMFKCVWKLFHLLWSVIVLKLHIRGVRVFPYHATACSTFGLFIHLHSFTLNPPPILTCTVLLPFRNSHQQAACSGLPEPESVQALQAGAQIRRL